MAMLEVLDSEFGRLLASITQEEKDNTVFIFIGDNRYPNEIAQEYLGTIDQKEPFIKVV